MKRIEIGTDIVSTERIRKILEKRSEHFARKILTLEEVKLIDAHQAPHLFLSGRFAAKEAVAKALGTGFGAELAWKDIEILNDPRGRPIAKLSSKAKIHFSSPELKISISHERDYAVAFAMVYFN